MIIAIDGPAASGKGTLAKRIAARFRPRITSTPACSIAPWPATCSGAAARWKTRAAAIAAARALDPATLDDPGLRGPGAGEAASIVARIQEVRTAHPRVPARLCPTSRGAVLDGRDIGTVVCPDADVKIYVTATPGGARRAALSGAEEPWRARQL